MKKLNKKNRAFLLFFILLTVAVTIYASFTAAKYIQTKSPGTFILEVLGDAPILSRDFVDVYDLKTDGTTKIVFDSFNNQKEALGLSDEDWDNNTNYAQQPREDTTELRRRIKVFKKDNVAYVLAERSYPVAFPAISDAMFEDANNITSIEFNLVGTRNVESMINMFNGCSALTELNLSGFNTTKVTNMSGMFKGCSALTELDLSNFNTDKVADMSEMFKGCSKLVDLDISRFDTSNVTAMSSMFDNCSDMRQTVLGKKFRFVGTDCYFPEAAEGNVWYDQKDDSTPFTPAELAQNQSTVTAVTTYVQQEKVPPVLYRDFMTKFSLKSSTTTKIVFDSWNNQKATLGLTDADWAKNTNYAQEAKGSPTSSTNLRNRIKVFKSGSTAYVLAEDDLPVAFPINSNQMFYNAYYVKSIDFNSIDTSKTTNMYRLFYYCYNLTGLDLSNFNTSNVTDMSYMFYNCYRLTSLNLSDFATSAVKNMSYMFYNCYGLTELDVTDFDTSNVTSMSAMFEKCSGLYSLDLSSFSTDRVTSMSSIFSGCSNLIQITLGKDFKFVGTNSYVPSVTGKAWYAQDNDNVSYTPAGVASNQRTVTDTTTYMLHLTTAPIIYRDFLTKFSLKTDGTTKIVFDTWNNQKDKLGLTDVDWVKNKNFAQESSSSATSSTNLRDGIKIFKSGTTAYVLADFHWNVVFPIDSKQMFYSAKALTNIDFNAVDTSNVTNMYYMFRECTALTELDLAKFNTEKVTDMTDMFYNCSALTSLNVTSFNTDKVTQMVDMFYNCSSLTDLDLSTINTRKASVRYTISKLYSLRRITLGKDCLIGRSLYVAPGNSWFVEGQYDKPLTPSHISVRQRSANNVTTTYVQMESNSPVLYKDFITKYKLNTDGTTKIVFGSWNDYRSKVGSDLSVWEKNTNYAQDLSGGTEASPTLGDRIKVFKNGSTAYVLAEASFDVALPSDSSSMFANMTKITSIVFDSIDTTRATNMARMFSGCSALTSANVSDFDTGNVTDMQSMFRDCIRLTSIDVSNFDTSNVTNMQNMFYNCTKLASLDISGFNTGSVTDMQFMFYKCSSVNALVVSDFDTSNVTNMRYMFYYCSTVPSLDVSGFDTRNVTDMQYMFYYCPKVTSLNVSGFDTSNVTNMQHMFDSCSALNSLNVSGFKTGNVTDMNHMFYNCSALKSLDVSKFDTSKVTYMQYMFNKCSNLSSLNVSSFKTGNVTDMQFMFAGCSKLAELNASKFDTSNVTNMQSMFSGCSGAVKLDLSNFDTSKVTTMQSMFATCSALRQITLGKDFRFVGTNGYIPSHTDYDWYIRGNDSAALTVAEVAANQATVTAATTYFCKETETIVYRGFMSKFSLTSGTTKVVFDNWDNYKKTFGLTDADWENNTNYAQQAKSGPTYSTGLRMRVKVFKNGTTAYVLAEGSKTVILPEASSSMFSGATALTAIEFNKVDTKRVTTMQQMFNGCSGLNSLDLTAFNTSSLTSMYQMFRNCSGLTSLDFSGFDTSNVTTMYQMFYGCSGLTKLDLSNFDTSNVTTMYYMFYGCSNLAEMDLSNFNTGKVTNMSSMFSNCSKLKQITLGKDFKFSTSSSSYLPTATWYVFGTDVGMTAAQVATNQNSVTEATTYTQTSVVTLYRDFMTKFSLKSSSTTKIVFDSWDNQKANLGLTDANWSSNTNNAQQSSSGPTASTNLRDGIKVFKSGSTAYVLAKGDNAVNFPIDSNSMFASAPYLTAIEFNSINTSGVKNMSSMFSGCTKLETLDVSAFDTRNVSNMSQMFNNCPKLISLDLSNFKTGKNVTMYQMFYNCSSLKTLDLSNFDTSNVITMERTFWKCTGLTLLNISSFDTSNVKTMSYMFDDCSSLPSLDVSNFDTSNVTNMVTMFGYCSGLTSLDLSNFNTSSVTRMENMFTMSKNLNQVTLGKDFKFVGSEYVGTEWVWNDGYLPAIDGYLWSLQSEDLWVTLTFTPEELAAYQKTVTEATTYVLTEAYAPVLSPNFAKNLGLLTDGTTKIVFDRWHQQKATLGITPDEWLANTNYADEDQSGGIRVFKKGTTAYVLSRGHMTMYLPYDSSNLFYDQWGSGGSTTLTSVEFIRADTSGVSDMSGMFQNNPNLTEIELSCFDTSHVTDFSYMFSGCSSLTQLELSNFGTSNFSSVAGMFSYCSSLTRLDLSNFSSSSNYYYDEYIMFEECDSLQEVTFSTKYQMNSGTLPDDWGSSLWYLVDGDGTGLDRYAVSNAITQASYNGLDYVTFTKRFMPVLSKNFIEKIGYMSFNTIVFDSYDNIVDYLIENHYPSVYDYIPESNWIQQDEYGDNDGRNLRNGIVFMQVDDALYILAKGNGCVRLPEDSSDLFNNSRLYQIRSYIFNEIDTSGVKDMSGMFRDCLNMTSVDTTKFDTWKVENMSNMFNGCSNLSQLDLSTFNTRKVGASNTANMFTGCSQLTNITLGAKFRFSSSNTTGYLPAAPTGKNWYVDGQNTALTPSQIATYQSTATTAITYVRK